MQPLAHGGSKDTTGAVEGHPPPPLASSLPPDIHGHVQHRVDAVSCSCTIHTGKRQAALQIGRLRKLWESVALALSEAAGDAGGAPYQATDCRQTRAAGECESSDWIVSLRANGNVSPRDVGGCRFCRRRRRRRPRGFPLVLALLRRQGPACAGPGDTHVSLSLVFVR